MASEKAGSLRPIANTGRLHRHRRLFYGAGLVLAALALVQSWRAPGPVGPFSGANVCTTAACIHTSSEILRNLSPRYKDLDPCADFEELVCGGWKQRHYLRPDQGSTSTGEIMDENNQRLLQRILESPYQNIDLSSTTTTHLTASSRAADEDNFDKLTTAYEACMGEPGIKELGIRPLVAFLERVKPLSLSDGVLFLARYGVSALVTFSVGADDANPDVAVVSVSPPRQIGLPYAEHYLNSTLLEAYQEVVAKVLSRLTGTEQDNVWKAVVDLERQIAAASPTQEEVQNITKSYHPMSLQEASALTPSIGIPSILSGLSPSYKVDRLIVSAPTYMRKLEEILNKANSSVLRSYLVWKATQGLYSYVDSPILEPYEAFLRELHGVAPNSRTERWRVCTGHVDRGLGWIASRFFVQRAFSDAARELGAQVVSDIKNQFIEKLKRSAWMDAETAAKAIEKMGHLSAYIGYPSRGQSPVDITDPDALRSFYEALPIRSDGHFSNALSMAAFATQEKWRMLGSPVDHSRWPGTSVTIVDASYNPTGNNIAIPAGIMQFPVWSVGGVPDYISYGAFGSVVGHELSHALDTSGRRYDQNGRYMRGADWWTNKTAEAFAERAECFVGQYANFSVPGPDGRPLHVNGRLTLDDNIADAGGVEVSFQAWSRSRSRRRGVSSGSSSSTSAARLPGLEHFTESQLFFVSYGNFWCSKQRPETAAALIYTDPHAPAWARILGTMANSRGFRESFACESKEPTCELW
ncbi:hypothetical protein QBC47DRAFT_463152 [Echria macrotheca]|uniref:Endothelin-converting enzyme 1 n=1 Tax=Echria macrotheca TaxID=438768 RepID=A0AAJ0B6I5_9PEZI|nr:hypothetical protein QBC47DRAFT_463152 [Echria macrotheca]